MISGIKFLLIKELLMDLGESEYIIFLLNNFIGMLALVVGLWLFILISIMNKMIGFLLKLTKSK